MTKYTMRAFSAVKQLIYLWLLWTVDALPTTQSPILYTPSASRNVTLKLFAELEELARIVDISYCVGTTGIYKPFVCASRCQDFKGFELVTVSTFTNTVLRVLESTWLTTSWFADLEHRSSPCRLMRLRCPLTSSIPSPNRRRLPGNILHSQHYC